MGGILFGMILLGLLFFLAIQSLCGKEIDSEKDKDEDQKKQNHVSRIVSMRYTTTEITQTTERSPFMMPRRINASTVSVEYTTDENNQEDAGGGHAKLSRPWHTRI